MTSAPPPFSARSSSMREFSARHAQLLGWLIPLAIAAIGGFLRFYRLGNPDTLVFDETYYVKDGYSLSQHGYERAWPEGANDHFNAGNPDVMEDSPAYVVHPPAGKWMIALGLVIFGADDSFAWRFSAALVGTLSILIIARIARRMFRSTLLGALAGLLLAVDGAHLVHSRTALLDVFLMFWVLAAFAALLVDRDQFREKLRRAALASPGGWASPLGPATGWRPWRLIAGLCLGLALGTKWSGLYAIAVFGILTVCWDIAARRAAGVQRPVRSMLLRDSVPAFILIVPVALVVYVATWFGWIRSTDAYDRQWAAENSGWWDVLPDWLASLGHYHSSAYDFHVGLASEHPYMSSPWGWLIQWRPTSFYFETAARGEHGCEVEKCAAAVTSLGNPVLWWAGALAVVLCFFAWLLHRDWRAGAICAGLVATYLPWFAYQERTIFTFYTIVMVPFVVLALTYALGMLWGPDAPRAQPPGAHGIGGNSSVANLPGKHSRLPRPSDSFMVRRIVAGIIVALIVVTFAFFWPIYTATYIPYESWQMRMWNPTWI